MTERIVEVDMTDPEWTGERRADPPNTEQIQAAKLPAVTRDDVRGFLERAFRNIALPPLSADDVTDIAGGLSGFLATNSQAASPDVVESMKCELQRQQVYFAPFSEASGDVVILYAAPAVDLGALAAAAISASRDTGDME